jgi:hypothetical protein
MRFLSLLLFFMSISARAEEEFQPFDITELPRGAIITLPHEMPTQAPVTLRLNVQASDKRQFLKVSTVSRQGLVRPIKIAVHDRLASKVHYLLVKDGLSAIYQFKGLSTIRLIPELSPKSGDWSQQRLILESNRPLGVSHENGESKERGLSEL